VAQSTEILALRTQSGTRIGRHHLHRPPLLGCGTEWTVDRDRYLQQSDQLRPNANVYDNASQAGTGTAAITLTKLFPTAVIALGADVFGAGAGRLSLDEYFDDHGLETLIVNMTSGKSDGFLEVIDPSFAPVPSPLPLFGASLADDWSRRLRQRMGVYSRQISR
jgi:hypothetical protein